MLKHHHGAADLSSSSDVTRTHALAPALSRLVPNAVTLIALGCGMTAIELAMAGRHRAAVLAIILAGVFDGLDGRAARLLNSASTFGAELDSLADVVSFGVAPAVLIYHWSLADFAGIGWAFAVFYAICCGLRLARFNTQQHDSAPASPHHTFTGVPAPAGAGLVLMPMYVVFASGNDAFRSPILNAAVITAVALLMMSRIPTWSLKRLHVTPEHVVPTIAAAMLIALLLATAPWWTLTSGGLLYIASIPLSLIARRRALAAERAAGRNGKPPAPSASRRA